MQRMGMIIGIKPDRIEEYKALHANAWPEVLEGLREANIRNYSIFMKDNLLFGYWEYHGSDFKADMKAMADKEVTQRWWALCSPCQEPLDTRAEGEWWAMMEQVFLME